MRRTYRSVLLSFVSVRSYLEKAGVLGALIDDELEEAFGGFGPRGAKLFIYTISLIEVFRILSIGMGSLFTVCRSFGFDVKYLY